MRARKIVHIDMDAFYESRISATTWRHCSKRSRSAGIQGGEEWIGLIETYLLHCQHEQGSVIGCLRVEDPVALAVWILRGNPE